MLSVALLPKRLAIAPLRETARRGFLSWVGGLFVALIVWGFVLLALITLFVFLFVLPWIAAETYHSNWWLLLWFPSALIVLRLGREK